MIHAQSLPSRSWTAMAWLLAMAFGGLVALINIFAGALLITLVTVLAVVFTWREGYAARRVPAAVRHTPVQSPFLTPMKQSTVYTAEGTARAALVVPAAGVEGYKTVLIKDGYVLVNAAGQIVYTLTTHPAA